MRGSSVLLLAKSRFNVGRTEGRPDATPVTIAFAEDALLAAAVALALAAVALVDALDALDDALLAEVAALVAEVAALVAEVSSVDLLT